MEKSWQIFSEKVCEPCQSKARFPLAELTIDGPFTRLVETRARQHGPC